MCKISVAMATYNGSRFIEEQLRSLLEQTREPDEVIIRDDKSSDDTAEKIRRFIKHNDLQDKWKLIVNEENIGWQRNFYEAVKQTTGDVIFFSDQDDVWLPDKIERLTEFLTEKHAGCVYGSIILIDENGNELKETRNTHGIDKVPGRIPFDSRFNTAIVMGCRMCISREIADIYIKLDHPMPDHDCQCARLALLYSSLWRIEKPVMRYRVHKGNNSGIEAELQEGSTTLEFRKRVIYENTDWLKTLRKFEKNKSDVSNSERIDMLNILIRMQESRYSYLSGKSGASWLKLLRYRNCYSGISMLIGDLAYRHGMNRALGKAVMKIKHSFRK